MGYSPSVEAAGGAPAAHSGAKDRFPLDLRADVVRNHVSDPREVDLFGWPDVPPAPKVTAQASGVPESETVREAA
jgi:hypothetical protein